MEISENERKALLCVRSLFNISKDLESMDEETFAKLAGFIASGLAHKYIKELPEAQTHGKSLHHDSNIRDEIARAVAEVKSQIKIQDKPGPAEEERKVPRYNFERVAEKC